MGYIVRRLTPTECERLQGFPDGWTDLGGTPDTPRYKALGNSMAVPCMRWLGERIQEVDDILGGEVSCPAMEECRRLIADGGTCVKYGRPCGNARGCFEWGYECDERYNEREGYEE